jgi:hypothetical protein
LRRYSDAAKLGVIRSGNTLLIFAAAPAFADSPTTIEQHIVRPPEVIGECDGHPVTAEFDFRPQGHDLLHRRHGCSAVGPRAYQWHDS